MQTSTKRRFGLKKNRWRWLDGEDRGNTINRRARRGMKINLKKYPKMLDKNNDVR